MSEIKVVPCPAHNDRYALMVDGKWYLDPNKFGMAEFCSPTKAEALEKAAELRKESNGTQEQVIKASRHPSHENLQAKKGMATASAKTAGETRTSRDRNQNANESVVAKLQEQFQCFDKDCSGCQHDAGLIASAIAAARPVETRPPAPTHAQGCTGHCQICGWSHGECCDDPCACAEANSYRRNCDTNTLKNPELAEQAAPPRPLDLAYEFLYTARNKVANRHDYDQPASEAYRLIEAAMVVLGMERTGLTLEKLSKSAFSDPINKILAAPAAIEQATPPTPNHRYSAKHPQAGICSQCGESESHESHAAAAEPAPERTPLMQTFDKIIQRIAELPDRSSPDDWPEAMLVTEEELRLILLDELINFVAAEPAPERTPQFVVDEEEAKGTWRRVGVFLTGENFTLRSSSNRVRIALAVPEPAAQQPLQMKEIFGDAMNDITATIFSFLTVKEDFLDEGTQAELRKDLQRFANALSRARQAEPAPTPSRVDTITFACGCWMKWWAEGNVLRSGLACCTHHEKRYQTIEQIFLLEEPILRFKKGVIESGECNCGVRIFRELDPSCITGGSEWTHCDPLKSNYRKRECSEPASHHSTTPSASPNYAKGFQYEAEASSLGTKEE